MGKNFPPTGHILNIFPGQTTVIHAWPMALKLEVILCVIMLDMPDLESHITRAHPTATLNDYKEDWHISLAKCAKLLTMYTFEK